MYCQNCGKESDGVSKFCTSCGKPVLASGDEKKETPIATPVTYSPAKKRRGPTIRAWVGIVVIGGLVIWGVYSSSQNDTAVQTANTALNTSLSSDSEDSTQQAIQQFKEAYNNATDDATKLTILTNLAITYNSDNDTTDAINTFQQALGYASQGTSEYYYISGELAELQNQPSNALNDFQQANQLLPNDPQITNALGLFYLDMTSSWTSYDDNAKALQYLKEAYGLENNDTTAQNLATAYYYNDDYQQSIALLLPLNLTNHPSAALWLGYDYAKEKDVKDAEFYFQKAIDLGVNVPQEVNDYMNSN